jgi:fibro-slime domain-containing protein
MKFFTLNSYKEATMKSSLNGRASAISRILLTLTLALAFFAGDALAQQCSGKTVYIRLPAGWGSTTYAMWEGNPKELGSGRKEGDWTVFTLPSFANDRDNKSEIVFLDYNNNNNQQQPIYYITRRVFGSGSQVPTGNTDKFQCSDFGPDKTYIYTDLANPNSTTTIINTNPPDAYYFYFLPPNDEAWILGKPYLFSPGSTPEPLELDPDNCGWYRRIYFNTPVPDKEFTIILGSALPPKDAVGLNGMGEDPSEWIAGAPVKFNLKTQFDKILRGGSGKMYFTADGEAGEYWLNGNSYVPKIENERCSYKFAAYVYQRTSNTSRSDGVGFSWYCDPAASSGSDCPNKDGNSFGLCKGLVKPKLTADGKMEWAGRTSCTNTYTGVPLSGWTEQYFNNAFKEITGESRRHCYNMPFTQRPGGLWEFDAFYLCKDGVSTDYGSTATTGCGPTMGGTGNVGGFYNMKDISGDPLGIKTNYDGDRVEIKPAYKWCFDRGWTGTKEGDLSNARTEAEINAVMNGACSGGRIVSGLGDNHVAHCPHWGNGTDCAQNSTPPQPVQPKGVRGGHLCFESQEAEFTYEPGQEFFFRGDDDIWVFLSNYLAIDLGGNHMPAPGYIKLDTLRIPADAQISGKQYESTGALVPNETYPIKIFFCDRRGAGSNVRISTNMYFAQKIGLSVDGDATNGPKDICLTTQGTSGGCSTGSGGGGNSTSSKLCGSDIANRLEYYLQKRDGTQIPLDASQDYCRFEGNNMDKLICYGGVEVYLQTGKVSVRTNAISGGLSGTYTVYVKLKDNSAPPKNITRFTVDATVLAVWDKIYDGNTQIYDFGSRTKNTVASKLVPVGFATGNWNDPDNPGGRFTVDTGDSIEFQLTDGSKRDFEDGKSSLIAYYDEAGTRPVDINGSLVIPESGLLILWVTGNYEANTDATYNLNVGGSKGQPLPVKVYLPRLAFLDPTTHVRLPTGRDNPLSKTKGSDTEINGSVEDKKAMVGSTLDRTVAAYDISGGGDGVLCTTCHFPLTDTSWGEEPPRKEWAKFSENIVIEFTKSDLERGIEGGIGNISFRGKKEVLPDSFAYFRIKGPSANSEIFAQWDSLLFEEPPIPYPVATDIFVTAGGYARGLYEGSDTSAYKRGGIGDSIRITYNRPFPRYPANPRDTLPNRIEINWDLSIDPIAFGLATKQDAKGDWTNEGIPAESWNYWNNPEKNMKIESDSIIVIWGIDFSQDIKTQVGLSEGDRKVNVDSWSTYEDPKSKVKIHLKSSESIEDSIAPIVIAAKYAAGSNCEGTGPGKECGDRITVTLSEPVKAISEGPYETPFAYRLLYKRGANATFEVYSQEHNLPQKAYGNSLITWLPSDGIQAVRDTSVDITYGRYRSNTDTTDTPMAGDWVKLAWDMPAVEDLKGNRPNMGEFGRPLIGKNDFILDKNLITGVDPKEDPLKKAVDDLLNGSYDKIFNDKNQVAILPVLDSWGQGAQGVKDNYPGSVGHIFRPDVGNIATTADAKDITFHAKAYYHTNLGNYVTHGEKIEVNCTDDRFKINGEGDCKSNKMAFYLAWNLKDAKNRWVGAGAYVEVFDFYWQVKDSKQGEGSVSQKIEMLGVTRTKSKK